MNLPFYSLSAPAMPNPGIDFLTLAKAIAGPDASDETVMQWVDFYYLSALYKPNFSLSVGLTNHQSQTVSFIPGHIWDNDQDTITYGPQPAKVMVVGKLPGYDESKRSRNLVGPSGKQLETALEEVFGEDESLYDKLPHWYSWYVTNLVKFPTPNRRSNAIAASWIKDCLPLLHEELRIVKPDYILCLGTEAAAALLGKSTSISNSAGQIFEIPIRLNKTEAEPVQQHIAKMVVCIHPAAVVRAPDSYSQLTSTLKLFRNLVAGLDVCKEDKDVVTDVVYTEEALTKIVDRLIADPAMSNIAVDAEWHGEYPGEPGAYLRTIQFSPHPKYACCVVLRHAGGKSAFEPGIQSAMYQLSRLLKNTPERKVRVIGHFFRADIPWLLHHGLDLRPEFDAPEDTPTKPGWERLATEGGFDTGMAAHSYAEAGQDYKLEVQAAKHLGAPRYDNTLHKWKVEYCKDHGMSSSDLEGYGDVPDEILHPYSLNDVIYTRRLFDLYNGIAPKPGLLAADQFGNNCYEAFWISQRAAPAFLEMELAGLSVDRAKAEELAQLYRTEHARLLEELRAAIKWPKFNPSSDLHRRELLFGEQYNNKLDTDGNFIRIRPEEAICLNLEPIATTGKRKKEWNAVTSRGEEAEYKPSCDKETLGIVAASCKEASLLRDVRFIAHTLSNILRLPKTEGHGDLRDDEGNIVFEKGILSCVCHDNRVRTHLYQTKETGRASSARPPLQNLSKRREADYKRMLGYRYRYPLRSILCAAPGHLLIEADYSGAEVMGMAIMANDKALIDHARRASLPESHQDYYDIHSNIAVQVFNLKCAPTKKGLKEVGAIHLRTVAKTVFFGYAYGQGPVAAARKAKEEGANVTEADARKVASGLKDLYPLLEPFFEECRARVHEPGWICNNFGRFRRFRTTSDKQALGEMERQAMNFPIQSMIADAVSRALDHLYHYRETQPDIKYKLALQIHDAIIMEVPISCVEKVWKEVIPYCMIDCVPLYQCNLDGVVVNKEPFYLGVGKDAYQNWGVDMTDDELLKLGLDLHN